MEIKIEKHMGLASIGTIVFAFQNLKKNQILEIMKRIGILTGVEVYHAENRDLGTTIAVREKFYYQVEDNTLSLVVYYSTKVKPHGCASNAGMMISRDIDGIAKTIGAALEPFDKQQ
jgi:glutamine synthetase type III